MKNKEKNSFERKIIQSIWVRQSILIIMDALFVVLAYLFTLLFRFGGAIPPVYYTAFKEAILVIGLIHILVNAIFHLYGSLWKHAGVDEIINVAGATLIATCLVYLYSIIAENVLPRSVYIAAGLILVLLFGFSRMFYRLLRRLKRGHAATQGEINTLIIGAGETGSFLAKQISEQDKLNIRLVGYIDDDPGKRDSHMNGYKVLGNTQEIPEIVKRECVEELIFAIPSAPLKRRSQILEICTATGCRVKIIPGLEQMLGESIDFRRMRDVNVEDLLERDPVRINTEEVSEYLTGSCVLVTGGGGSIGSELCKQIALFKPKRLIIFDIYENNAYELYVWLKQKYGKDFPVEVVIGSIRDMKRIDEVFAKYQPDIVFHAAAHKHVPLMEANPGEAIKNNVNGTFIVAKAADIAKVKRFVLISTDKAVNPTNIMGATKYLCELIMQYMNQTSKQTQYTAVRFGNVLGSNGSVIPLFKRQVAEGGPVTVTHKDVTRYFMTIPEAAQLVIQAGAMIDQGQIFILDMGEPVKIDEFARAFIRLSGFEPDVDIPIVYTGLRPGEKMYEELWQNEEDMSESSFPGIFVGKSHPIAASEIKAHIDYLRVHADAEPEKIHEYIAKVVPTYQRRP